MKLTNNSLTDVPSSLMDGLLEHTTHDSSINALKIKVNGKPMAEFGDFILEGSSAQFHVEIDAPDYWKLEHIVRTNGAHCGVLNEEHFKGHSFIIVLNGYSPRVEGRRDIENEPIGFTIDSNIEDGVSCRNERFSFEQDRPSILRQEYADYRRSGSKELHIPSRDEIKHEGSSWSASHFKLWEFTKKNNYTDMFLDRGIVKLADSIRKRFGHGIKITSGYRCPQRNKAVNGAKYSRHMTGKAVDLLPMEMGAGRIELRDLYNAAIASKTGGGKVLLEKSAVQLLPSNHLIPEGKLDKTKTFLFSVEAEELQKDGENYTLTFISGSTMPSELNQLRCGTKIYKILSTEVVEDEYRYEAKFKTADALKREMDWALTGSYADLLKFATHVHVQL